MEQSDAIILGGGLVGLALAAALDASGLSSTIVDPADPDAQATAAFDGRTSAVSSSLRRMFDAIGVTPHFPEPGGPIRRIRTADGVAPGSLSFDAEEDGEPLGWMHQNRHLRAALRARAEAAAAIRLRYGTKAVQVDRGLHGVIVALTNGETLRAPLLIAAEGRNSAARQAAGIRVARWRYAHRAIVSILRHGRPHDGVAYELFYPAGPFALLPMTDNGEGHRSASARISAPRAGWSRRSRCPA